MKTDKLLQKSLSLDFSKDVKIKRISAWPECNGAFSGEFILRESDTISEIFKNPSSLSLVFASAKNPGGGVLRGAKAQEEVICATSNVFNYLSGQKEFYADNKKTKIKEYLDEALFAENVTFFFDQYGNRLKNVKSNLLFYPAPNRELVSKEVARKVFKKRLSHILTFAATQNFKTLILGEWGCGVFGNDSSDIGPALKAAMQDSGLGIEQIIFTIFDNKNNVLDTYKNIFI